MKEKTTPIRIHIPQLEELRKIAAREDRSVAWIIRKMIDEGIERQKRKK
jgi:predicted DNA-binding protein